MLITHVNAEVNRCIFLKIDSNAAPKLSAVAVVCAECVVSLPAVSSRRPPSNAHTRSAFSDSAIITSRLLTR